MAKTKTLSAEKIKELSRLAKRIDREEADEIKTIARASLARHDEVRGVIAQLKAARLAQGMTLTAAGEKSGIGKANLSRLENLPDINPTMDTLLRYAETVGVRLAFKIVA